MKSKQRDIAYQNRITSRIYRSPLILAAELLILVLLLVTASYAPQMIFQIQDSFLCDRTTLDRREGMDVESLSITYEKSLMQRMKVFAEGLMSEVNYYVTSRDLTINEEIYDYLASEKGLLQPVIQIFAEVEFIPYSFYEMHYVNAWKQYVICSDNYAEGVNFILWYIELLDNQGTVLKLLMDAETDTLYAFKTENNDHSHNIWTSGAWETETLIMWWNFFANYYEALSQNGLQEILEKFRVEYETMLIDGETMLIDGYGFPNRNEYDYTAKESELFVRDNAGFQRKENGIDFYLPYEEASLEVCILLDTESIRYENMGMNFYYQYPNMTIGVRQIYELIPEFA